MDTPKVADTSTPELYPTADSSAPLSSQGPWMAIMAKFDDQYGRVKVMNQDGSGLRQLPENAFALVGSSTSPYLAVLIDDPILDGKYAGTKALEIIHLPELSKKIIPLIASPEIEAFDYGKPPYNYSDRQYATYIINYAISKPPSWSPSGRLLAFTAAIDGPSTDLYVYDTLTDQIRRLSDGPEMATQPEWSPDSKWIIHRGLLFRGEGCEETGVWAAASDGSQVKWIYSGECFIITNWVGPDTFDMDIPQSGGARRTGYIAPTIRINITSGTSTLLTPVEYLTPEEMLPEDCITRQKINVEWQFDTSRFDSPDKKWYVIANDELRLFTFDGKLVAEFTNLQQFLDWQPDSSAMVFTRRRDGTNPGTIDYYQVAVRTLKTYPEIPPVYFSDVGNLIWGYKPSSFYVQKGRNQEMEYINPASSQFLRVIWTTGEFLDLAYTWIGSPKVESNTYQDYCYFQSQP